MSSRVPPRTVAQQARWAPSAPRGAALRWRIVTMLLVVSLLPLVLLGVGAWLVFGGLLEQKSLTLHREVVRNHGEAIDRYLGARQRALTLVAQTHRLDELGDRSTLEHVLAELGRIYEGAFVDLGVIDASGRHLAYVGPYALRDKNYADAPWFRHVMLHGSYVSDVFLGFRGVPHCVIAVRHDERPAPWILRATINSAQFDAIVRADQLGHTVNAYILNTEGVYQTPPRGEPVLSRSPISMPAPREGLHTERVAVHGVPVVRVTTWLNEGRWLLVVEQDEAEIRAPIRRAMTWGVGVILVAVALLVGTTVLATWHLTREIDHAIEQRNQLSRDLVRSARLASLGELATGLAHEINNPLAIMSSERTNVTDLLGDVSLPPADREELMGSMDRIRRQIERCSGITSKMLRFGRQSESAVEPTSLGPRIEEVRKLMSKQAEVRNVALLVDVEPELPAVALDPTELEQVLVNLVTNSLQAMDEGGQIRIRAARHDAEVVLSVEDDGAGIASEDLDRIFQPFFTTKPVGKGTGLGLAVCYGLVHGWGGTIQATSERGHGTTLSIHLPLAAGATETS